MTFRIPTLWLIAAAASAAICATFAVTFYPRGPSEEEKYAIAAQRKKAYDTIGKGYEAIFAEKKDEALAKFHETLTIDPGVSSAHYLIGTIELNDGNIEEAVSEFDQALKLDKYPEHVYNNRGAARMRLGDLDGALKDFNAALKLKPGFRQPQTNRGLVYLRQDNPAAALKDFDAIIASYQQPSDGIEVYVGRAIARAKLGDIAGAEADLTLAREWVKERPESSISCATGRSSAK